MRVHIQTYTHTGIHTGIHTYRHTYIQAYIYTYIHTYIQYIHTYTFMHYSLPPQQIYAFAAVLYDFTFRASGASIVGVMQTTKCCL